MQGAGDARDAGRTALDQLLCNRLFAHATLDSGGGGDAGGVAQACKQLGADGRGGSFLLLFRGERCSPSLGGCLREKNGR